MKKTISLITLIVIVFTASACQQDNESNKSTQLKIQESKPINPPMHLDRIKNATLLIEVQSIQPDGVTRGFDMATLVQHQGEIYLVTHNHYGDMLQDMNIVQLRDAENHKIRSMYGSEFKSLIVCQDPGTLVLRAPAGLPEALTPVNVDHQPQLQPGNIVQVAYRGGAKREQVEIVDAVIEDITVSGVTPVYRLRFPDGQLLSPGDSGGGVWYGETFVGNIWSIVLSYTIVEIASANDSASESQTDLSYAAIFPEMFR
ncbi:MAG TPA: hypothetical protein VFR47_31335 [Anaerolineales bacterium]|nr:hypothetical protein [Anaerolineales bacterium]